MKTTTVARGFIGAVASLLGVVAVGCSADVMDEGAAGEGVDIGVTEQALAPADVTLAQAKKFAASCRLKDTTNNVEYMVYAGGINSAGNPSNAIVLADYAGTFVTQTATLSSARTEAKALALGDDLCYVVSGINNGGNGDVTVDVLKLTPGTPATVALSATITPANLPAGEGRRAFEMFMCTDSNSKPHLVVFPGYGDSGTANLPTSHILVSDDITKTTAWNAWTTHNGMSAPGGAAGVSPNNSANNREYIYVGGDPAGSLRTNVIDVIQLGTNCQPANINAAKDNSNNPVTLPVSVDGLVAFRTNTAGVFGAAAGRVAGGLWGDISTITVSNFATGLASISTATPTAGTFVPTYRPTLVERSVNSHDIFGGANNTINASLNAAQNFGGVTPSQYTALPTAVFGAAASFLSTAAKSIVVSGEDLGTGLSLDVEER